MCTLLSQDIERGAVTLTLATCSDHSKVNTVCMYLVHRYSKVNSNYKLMLASNISYAQSLLALYVEAMD